MSSLAWIFRCDPRGPVTQGHLEGFIFKADSPLCLESAISDPGGHCYYLLFNQKDTTQLKVFFEN